MSRVTLLGDLQQSREGPFACAVALCDRTAQRAMRSSVEVAMRFSWREVGAGIAECEAMRRCCTRWIRIEIQHPWAAQPLSLRISSARIHSARFRLTPRSMLCTGRVCWRRPWALRPGSPPWMTFSWSRWKVSGGLY